MVDEPLSDDERYVLECAGDESGAFTFLAWLGSTEHHPDRAAAAIARLLDRGLIQIEEHSREARRSSRKWPRQVRPLGRDDALVAIRDPRKWRDPEAEPFASDESYYEAHATDAGIALLRSLGWQPS